MAEKIEWITVEQAARELGVHPETIRSFIKDGELPALQLKRNYRIKRQDFDDFVRRRYSGSKDQ